MLKCPKCGTELEYGMRECDFCFRPLTDRELTQLEREHFEADYSTKFARQIQRKKNTKKWIIIVACILIVAVLAVVVCQIVFQKSIVELIKSGTSSLYQIVFNVESEETEEEKFLRLKDFTQQLCDKYKDTDYPKSIYGDFDEYLISLLEINLDINYPNEFDVADITVETYNGRITQFTWKGWIYLYKNGYSEVIPPYEQ